MRSCPVCSGSEPVVLGAFGSCEWPVVQCTGCGLVYLGRVPGYGALVEEFAWETTFAAAKRQRARTFSGWMSAATRWRMTLARLPRCLSRNRFVSVAGNVLDIGCGGTCRIPPGPVPFGIEISRRLSDQARPKFEARGGSVVSAPALEALDSFEDEFFSAVMMRSYLEHEEQPRAVLEKASARLKPGGAIYVRVPNFGSLNRRLTGRRWCGFRFPDHVNYFTPATLRDLARRTGFRYRRLNWYSPFDDNLIVELTKPATPRPVREPRGSCPQAA